MVERGQILKLWQDRRDSSGVLVTLVRVEGSSYRRPGARMYIHSGTYAGSISGGCLEGEVVRKAAWLTRAGAAVERYSTLYDSPFDKSCGNDHSNVSVDARFGDNGEMPYGLGCGGVIDVLLEPTAAPESEAILVAFEAAQSGKTLTCATLLPAPGQSTYARIILDQSGETVFASAGIDATCLAHLSRLAHGAELSDTISIALGNESRNVFVESILPPQRLVIFGAGEDARPLARLAHWMGWRIAVADGRARLAQPARFPEAEQVVVLGSEKLALDALQLTNRDAVAMLTHSFEQDKMLLPQLLPLELRYLGLLGARHRSQLLLTQAAQQLRWPAEECLRRVHAPIGLNLGGDSPEAVALTIIAEIQAVLQARDAGSRRMSEESFRIAPDRPYVPAQCPLDEAPNSSDTAQFAR